MRSCTEYKKINESKEEGTRKSKQALTDSRIAGMLPGKDRGPFARLSITSISTRRRGEEGFKRDTLPQSFALVWNGLHRGQKARRARGRRLALAHAAVNSAKRELAYRIDAHETACPECYNREPLNPKPRLPHHPGLRARERAPVSIVEITRVTLLFRAASVSLIRFHESVSPDAGSIIARIIILACFPPSLRNRTDALRDARHNSGISPRLRRLTAAAPGEINSPALP